MENKERRENLRRTHNETKCETVLKYLESLIERRVQKLECRSLQVKRGYTRRKSKVLSAIPEFVNTIKGNQR